MLGLKLCGILSVVLILCGSSTAVLFSWVFFGGGFWERVFWRNCFQRYDKRRLLHKQIAWASFGGNDIPTAPSGGEQQLKTSLSELEGALLRYGHHVVSVAIASASATMVAGRSRAEADFAGGICTPTLLKAPTDTLPWASQEKGVFERFAPREGTVDEEGQGELLWKVRSVPKRIGDGYGHYRTVWETHWSKEDGGGDFLGGRGDE